jgi:hypothetical protein
MIPAGIMSIFVDGRMNWVLSEEYRCEEGNYGRCPKFPSDWLARAHAR